MTRDQFIQFIEDGYAEGIAIIKKKNADYADGSDPFQNFKESAQFARTSVEVGFLHRLGDKLTRLKNLMQEGREAKVLDETLEDTFLDAINYLAIFRAYVHNKKLENDILNK